MWQLDGWGARVRIGILMPNYDIGPEVEFAAMAPEGVTIHSTRVPSGVMPGAAIDRLARAFAELVSKPVRVTRSDVRAEGLDPRPIGGGAAGFPAAAPEHEEPAFPRGCRELVGETTLAYPRLACQQEQAPAAAGGLVEAGCEIR